MSIIVTNLTKRYGEQIAVNNISFTAETGQILGFIGPNGAGKSTSMKVITGSILNFEGTVEINGTNIKDDPLKAKEKIGYLPEHNPLYLEMYVKEYLRHTAGFYKLDKPVKQRIEEVIELTGLEAEQKKKIGSLSKGYRQRVGLAAAIIHDPEVLILDEPTTGLDPNQIVEIRNLIKSLGEKKTVMLSTHIMQEVEAICNKIVLINKGEIAVQGSAGEIKEASQSRKTVIVEFSQPADRTTLEKIKGIESTKELEKNTWLIACKENADPRQEIFSMAVETSNAVLSMQMQEQKLEDVFKELTSK